MGTYKHLSPDSFSASGASLLDLFETAGLAMLRMEYDTSIVGFEREISISASAPTLEGLFEAWLDQLADTRRELGIVVGDVIVVEVGRPPMQRYGDTSLTCRGAARGRAEGEWFAPPKRRLAGAVPATASITQRRRAFDGSASVRWDA